MIGAQIDHHRPPDLEEQIGKVFDLRIVKRPLARCVFDEQVVDIDRHHVAEPDGPAGMARLERIQMTLQQHADGDAVSFEKSDGGRITAPFVEAGYLNAGCNQKW